MFNGLPFDRWNLLDLPEDLNPPTVKDWIMGMARFESGPSDSPRLGL
jgi:hypothetical protein